MSFYQSIEREHVHELSVEELFGKLDTSHQGLSPKQVANRQERYGRNTISEKKKTSVLLRFSKHLTNRFAILLWVGSILSFFAEYFQPGQGMIYIGIALVAVVFLNAFFTFWQESKVEHAMAAFKNMLSQKARVVRNGKEYEIDAQELVPGDILILAEGDKIPADARIFEVNALKVNNASLTGESEPQLRTVKSASKNHLDSRNLAFSGTLVSAGSGKAVVYATGDQTELGRIAHVTIETKSVESPLQKEIAHFITIISRIAIILGVFFFAVGWMIGKPFWGNLIFAIGIIVANVPEGLLPTVTLALSIASQRMAKKNALIKKLESVETLGSTTVICTDKTGTLTVNNMHVTNLYLNGCDYQTANVENTDDYARAWTCSRSGNPHTKDLEQAMLASVLCNNAALHRENNDMQLIGDPTETALLLFGDQVETGPNVDWVRQQWPRKHEIPFDSATKEMITVNEKNGKRVAYLKGAPEQVLKECTHVLAGGVRHKLTDQERTHLLEQNIVYANGGKRVLALAYQDIKSAENSEQAAKEPDYTFIGLAVMYDPPRPEVHEAVKTCQEAGIKIIVISGDHPVTVGAIAKDVGIVQNPRLITGEELAAMSHTELKRILTEKELVFARTSPQDKMRIVSALQELNEVVAVTGDGVNDAPALKKADIGVAMGITGTEVAKEASDMILIDDNFSTIVSAVEEGRVIYSNIRKFIAYILTSNIPEILPFIAFVLLNVPLPLTVVLILAIDLGTDLIPALGLATESAESDVMKQKPRDRKERLLSRRLLGISYGIIGMIQAAAGFTAYFYILFNNGWTWGQELAFNDPAYQQAIAAFFVSIVIVQVADVLICRTRKQSLFTKGVFSNKLVWVGIATELCLALLILYAPWAQTVFNTAPISWQAWLIPIPFALLILAFDETRKFLVRKNNAFVQKYLVW